MKHTVAAAFAFAVLLLATDAVKPIHAQPVPNAPAQPSAGSANQTPAQRLIGGFAPKSALIAMNRPEQLRSHLQRARDNGVTMEELSEVMTHLAFYTGWPNALTAIGVARDVFEKN